MSYTWQVFNKCLRFSFLISRWYLRREAMHLKETHFLNYKLLYLKIMFDFYIIANNTFVSALMFQQ